MTSVLDFNILNSFKIIFIPIFSSNLQGARESNQRREKVFSEIPFIVDYSHHHDSRHLKMSRIYIYIYTYQI